MKILIMCGGRGRRLGPLTQQVPKPLIELNNRTILEIKIESYVQQGFKEFIFCIGYMGELIKEKISQLPYDIDCEFSDAGREAGILKRLYHASDLFESQVLMTYGDTFTDIDLGKLIESHNSTENDASIVVAPVENPFGIVDFDHNNKAILFKEKPILNYYIGYAVFNKSMLDLIPKKVLEMSNGDGIVTCYKILIAMRKLGVYHHSGLQVTFNTPEERKSAEKKLVRFYSAPEKKYEK